jgi:predicted lipid-binding transport protein (Tim44 family)
VTATLRPPAPMKGVSMSKAQAKRYALLGTVAAATLAIVADLQRGNTPDPRVILGAVIAAVLLTLFAELAPAVAGGLSVVLLLTALLVTGADVWRWTSGVLAMSRASSSAEDQRAAAAAPGAAARNYATGTARQPSSSPSRPPAAGSGSGGGGGGAG